MEQEILQMLRNSPGHPFSAKEIGKKLDRKQFVEDHNWARPILQRLAEQKVIMHRADGYYLFPTSAEKD